jgi:hypothetical protein
MLLVPVRLVAVQKQRLENPLEPSEGTSVAAFFHHDITKFLSVARILQDFQDRFSVPVGPRRRRRRRRFVARIVDGEGGPVALASRKVLEQYGYLIVHPAGRSVPSREGVDAGSGLPWSVLEQRQRRQGPGFLCEQHDDGRFCRDNEKARPARVNRNLFKPTPLFGERRARRTSRRETFPIFG